MWNLARVDKAVRDVLKFLQPPPVRAAPLREALGMVAAEDVYSRVRLPPCPKATMDGYAVRSEDVEHAAPASPAVLRLLPGRILPSQSPGVEVGVGECVAIDTGGYLPRGADAVVEVEATAQLGDRVLVYRPVRPYENVSLPGEELEEGDPILRRGDVVRPWHLSALEASGYESVSIYDLRAAAIYAGDELVEGRWRPFTRWIVEGWLAEHSFKVVDSVVVGDDPGELRRVISRALEEAHVVVVCAGSAVGPGDNSVRAVGELHPEVQVRGMAIRPGKTTTASVVGGRLVLNVSGLPVAALSSLELFLKELLRAWLGARFTRGPVVRARLARRVTNKRGLRCFVRVRVYEEGGGLVAEPLMTGGSGSLRSLLLGNGVLIVPEDVEGFDEGEEVEVELYGPLG